MNPFLEIRYASLKQAAVAVRAAVPSDTRICDVSVLFSMIQGGNSYFFVLLLLPRLPGHVRILLLFYTQYNTLDRYQGKILFTSVAALKRTHKNTIYRHFEQEKIVIN